MSARALDANEAAQFSWTQSGPAARVMAALDVARAGGSRYVGGCVRDSLAGCAPKDIDIATQLAPDAVIAALKASGLGAAPTGLAHGTVTAIADHVGVEVTTLRADVSTDGRRATVAYTQDWETDARRRDFTVNALYVSSALALYDPVGGAADLAARRIRFIGRPEDRIREDFLRILRFFRFSARFARDFDAAGLAACATLKEGISRLSAERIGDEMGKTLALARAPFAMEAMARAGILNEVWPHPADLEVFVRLKRDWADAPAPVGLAALFGAAGDGIDQRLRLSGAAAGRRKAALAGAAAVDLAMGTKAARAAQYRLGVESFADGLALAAARAGVDPSAELRRLAAAAPPRFALSGRDVLAAGASAGPRVAEVLKAVEERWIAEDFPDEARQRALLADALR